MRFTVFLALVIATFFACVTLISAESAALPERNLRAQAGVGTGVSKVFKADDIAAKFIETMNEKKILAQAAKMAAGAKDASKLTTKQTEKLTKMVAATVKKNPSKWAKLRKYLLYTLGVTVGGAIIYNVGKSFVKTAAPATNGSA
ncbi:putative secreted RxLR effector protein [Phytophthora cinnamomi]|uniref:putative secreted RxLR effector protein n=1 Tax=Phytophthora cinnamomi TaxID=4785 RepID=UPI00355A4955|nr:putative secreted RxLR effector protein [Phytophthora cinnamomi]